MNKDSDKFRKMIVDGKHFSIPEEDRKFIDSKNLSSDDLFRVFKILALILLGLKVIDWNFDCERDVTTIWYE